MKHFAFAGLVAVQNDSDEAVTMHVYIKSLVEEGKVVFRGVMFAESSERDWWSYLDGYMCQPDVARENWPGLFVRCALPGLLRTYTPHLQVASSHYDPSNVTILLFHPAPSLVICAAPFAIVVLFCHSATRVRGGDS